MSFNDDEQLVAPQDSEPRPPPIVPGRVELRIIRNTVAPLEESKLKVMLELTGEGSTKDRPGLDLVAVLDVSGSMEDENKIGKLKTAMLFVIKKLSPIDRLSVVTFSGAGKKECPLRQITKDSQTELENLINGLNAGGTTNIAEGLETGLRVLRERSFSDDRVVGIMLMSDGEEKEGDATKVPIGDVPVHTFGFGADHDPRVLKAIADNNKESTFSSVQNTDDLSKAFSQCLAGLLTVVVQDLKLTVKRIPWESTIEKVSAGSYLPPNPNYAAGSLTVTFGNLYSREVRKVIVDLILRAIEEERGADVLEISYSYSFGGTDLNAPPATLTVFREGISEDLVDRPEVITEETRLRTAQMMKEARLMAEDKKLKNAQKKLADAQNSLEDVVDQSNPLVDMLKAELNQLYKFMKSPEIYEKQGRAFALSSESCHERQRFAARGDIDNLRLFATPRMDKYLEQANSFVKDPSKPLPSVDEDVKEELAANPLAPLVGPITFYIQAAIQALQAIQKLFTRGL